MNEKHSGIGVLYAVDEYAGASISFVIVLVVTKEAGIASALSVCVFALLWLFTKPPDTQAEEVVPPVQAKAKLVFKPKPKPIKLKFGEVLVSENYKVNIINDSTFILSLKGYGKTVLLYTILMGIHKNFDYKMVQILVIDYKEVSLRWLKNSPFLFKNTVFTNGLGVRAASAELSRRKGLYADLPSDVIVDNLSKYNKVTKSSLPHLLIIVDEVQEASDETKELLTKINKTGRSLGIIVMAATQRGTSESISRSFLSQFRHRFVGYNITKTEYKYAGIKDDEVIAKMDDSKGLFAITTGSNWDVVQTTYTRTNSVEELSRSFKPKVTLLEGNDVQRNTTVATYFATLRKKPKITDLVEHYGITADEARTYLKLWSNKK